MDKLLYYSVLNYPPELLEKLARHFQVVTLKNPEEDTASFLSEATVVFAPLGFPFDEKKLGLCKNLKVVASNTTGTPHIDLKACEKRNVKVVSLSGQSEFLETITPTAEHSFGLLLSLLRNTIPASQSVLKGQWSRWPFGAPKMLSRMSLGIVGLGRIGRRMARYADAFGMKSFYFDPYVETDSVAQRVESISKLVSQVDVVSVHATLNGDTQGLFGRELFSHFKRGSYFVNTARGGIVNSESLLFALENKIIAGAALDVLEEDFDAGRGDVLNHPLVQYAKNHSNLILTPHIGGSTEDAWYETQNHTIELVLKALGFT